MKYRRSVTKTEFDHTLEYLVYNVPYQYPGILTLSVLVSVTHSLLALHMCVCPCCSLLGQCAVKTVSLAPGKGFGRASQSAALIVSRVLMEKLATQQVSMGINICVFV